MGACSGKKKVKTSTTSPTESPPITEPSIAKPQNKSTSNGSVKKTEGDKRLLTNTDSGVDFDILLIVDEQDEISRRLAQSSAAARLVPVNDAELEADLAALVYGHPERDYAEDPLVAPVLKSTEV